MASTLDLVRPEQLRSLVERVSVPRPFVSKANRDTRAWLAGELNELGCTIARGFPPFRGTSNRS